jgi:hypothetical protein
MNIKTKKNNKTQQSKLTETALHYFDLLKADHLNEMDIDNAIEELRPVRMWFHAIKYGDAPGFRTRKDIENHT